MAGLRTAVATGCDPECKWGQAIAELSERREASRAEVEEGPYEGDPNDVRPTTQGYEVLEQLQRDYLGLTGLRMSVENCQAGRVEACGPENYAADRVNWGYEVEVAIKSIRGE